MPKSPNIEYVYSLMLANGWDEMDKAFGGNLMVGVRFDHVIIDGNRSSSLERSNTEAYGKQEYEQANRAVSELVYVRRDGGWVVIPE